MCEVVHGVCVPFIACTPVRHVQDTIHNRVAEVHVGACHVYLGTENHLARFYVATVHLAEKAQALFCRTVAVGAVLSGFGRGAFLLGNLLRCLLINVCTACCYAPLGKIPKLLEIVAGIAYLAPFETKPFDIFFNGAYEFQILFLWICVIETEVAHTAIFLRHTEIYGNGLGVANVEVTVRLGRKTGLQPAPVQPFLQVVDYNLFNKAYAFLFALLGFICRNHCSYVVFMLASFYYANIVNKSVKWTKIVRILFFLSIFEEKLEDSLHSL